VLQPYRRIKLTYCWANKRAISLMDAKTKEIRPAKLSKAISAFMNADGGPDKPA
jgi:hypothetical protein